MAPCSIPSPTSAASQIPILGIHTGRLGFLATITPDRIAQAIDALFKGHFTIEERSLIRVDTDPDVFGSLNFGLNEFSILKRDTSSMIVVHTYIDGEYLNSYWADGLVVATPTGSTGYSLSCGGPVMLPQTNNFIIAPVCPHNLNVRPLVVSDQSVISFEIEGRSTSYMLALDSRSLPVEASVQIAVRRETFNARLSKAQPRQLPQYLAQQAKLGPRPAQSGRYSGMNSRDFCWKKLRKVFLVPD